MKLLLDEMFDGRIAEALRERGHDVVSIQNDRPELRGQPDASVFAAAQVEHRSLVTENAGDFVPIVTSFAADGTSHWGLVLTSNRSFPRHKPGRAVNRVVAALEAFARAHPEGRAPQSMTTWLTPPGS